MSGNTAALVDAFCRGAQEAGHTVHVFNVANLSVHPCTDCRFCFDHAGECAIHDDMQRIMRELEQGVENFNEFTQILVDNPSVLISGRSEKERVLP